MVVGWVGFGSAARRGLEVVGCAVGRIITHSLIPLFLFIFHSRGTAGHGIYTHTLALAGIMDIISWTVWSWGGGCFFVFWIGS